MKQWVKDVLEIQTADMRTKRMNARLKNIPSEKKDILSSLTGEQGKIKKYKDQILASEREIKAIESKIAEFNSKIEDMNKKSAMIKKNEEYKAMLTEIAKAKFAISSFETSQLQVYEKLEAEKKDFQSAEKTIKNIQGEIEASINELDELEKLLQKEINEALEKRKPFLEKLEKSYPEIFPIYTRLIKKDGEPLAKTRNVNCGFCHLKLIPQTLNDAKKGVPVTCDSCGHLIYYQED
ncbi:MAG TPA: hypothetical protein DD381_14490 [Lentisphaeria bacterium]|nr:MAG: hypothetical protein A2X47_01310 [Lentisphaerae bacterium GWF2_38_69]HBM17534.1 hypothetical protein [Lentisphaeria bacterium]